MWCYISQANSVVLEVEVDSKANGQDCLDKVCQKLGIIEIDYFGLQYIGSKGEALWLNMRNRIQRQMSGPGPYRFKIKVKFYVQPHLLLQDTTRNQFYLNMKQEFVEGQLKCDTLATVAQISALIAQAEYGDLTSQTQKSIYCTNCNCMQSEHDNAGNNNPLHYLTTHTELLNTIQLEHSQLKGLKTSTAQYQMLQVAAQIENFGVEYHSVRDADGVPKIIGVGPEGIFIYTEEMNFINSIHYPTIQMATHAGKCVFLTLLGDKGLSGVQGFKLISQKAANGLYRCVTEKHSFYRCDTVRNAVSTQYSRDLKGKKYIFDIRRTCREVHDHARRLLFTSGAINNTMLPMEIQNNGYHSDSSDCSHDIKEKLERLEDLVLCRVCLDCTVDTVFIPCGHTACSTCVTQLSKCPMCRQDITNLQHMFMNDSSISPTNTLNMESES